MKKSPKTKRLSKTYTSCVKVVFVEGEPMVSVSTSPKVLEPELKKIRILLEMSVLKSKADWENYRRHLKEEGIK